MLSTPNGNETTDAEINRLSISEERIVVSKDRDFYSSITAKKEPYKFLHVRTGNITNTKLIQLFNKNFATILRELEDGDVVVVDQHYLIALH